jgi:hypothetical protein
MASRDSRWGTMETKKAELREVVGQVCTEYGRTTSCSPLARAGTTQPGAARQGTRKSMSRPSPIGSAGRCADWCEPHHVHLLVNYPPKVGLSELVNSVKGVSSRLIKQEFPAITTFWSVKKSHGALWSASYFAGSVGGAYLNSAPVRGEAEPASGRCALNPRSGGRGTSLISIGGPTGGSTTARGRLHKSPHRGP